MEERLENIQTEENGINWADIIMAITQNLVAIIVICVICVAGSIGYTRFIQETEYSAKTSVIVFAGEDPQATSTTAPNAKVQFAIFVAMTFSAMVTDNSIIKTVKEQIKPQRPFTVSAYVPENILIVTITVVSSDAEEAAALANAFLVHSIDFVTTANNPESKAIFKDAVFQTLQVNITAADTVANKHTARNLMIGVGLGVLISAAYVILRILLDNTFGKTEDIERVLGIKVLATLPKFEAANEEKK